jgi:tRNA pseudouridine38-40 synthase
MARLGPRRTLKLTIAYDGTRYVGWQFQNNGPSIQAELERALHAITGENARFVGAGRTDAGVHARAMVAHVHTRTTLPAGKLALALNAHLPKDIGVDHSEDAPDDFHSRRDARGKCYRYTIVTGRARPVLDRLYTAHVSYTLDVPAMADAAQHLVGTYDFSAFVTELKARQHHCVRTITRAEVWQEERRVLIEVEGNGFLYNMVRTIAGTLVVVGKGKQRPKWVADVIASRDRREAGPVMPAKGLCLMRVFY